MGRIRGALVASPHRVRKIRGSFDYVLRAPLRMTPRWGGALRLARWAGTSSHALRRRLGSAMSGTDEHIPSLAELRRKPVRRRAGAAPRSATPSLFDSFPPPVEEPAPVVQALAPVPAKAEAEVAVDPPSAKPAEPRVWTVAQLVRQVRERVENAYRSITVEGEISNWRPAASGHCYFTLKDGAAQLNVVMFRSAATRVTFRPKDGDAVRVTGQLTVFESRGQMQLAAEKMVQVGLGALLAAVRELKERLRREGLFDRKRPLPAFPKCIGVVTSLQGAALRDIVKVCKRRHAGVNLLIYPVAVQGPRCAIEVERAVKWFSAHADRADVVIVARGGGSWEDLHGFDDERVARAIAACAVPVISGIGHAPDTVIADAAADVCAPTPSAAAELVTAAQHRVEERVLGLEQRVARAGQFAMLRARQRFSRLSAEMVLRRAQDGWQRRAQRIDELEFRAEGAMRRRLRVRDLRVDALEARVRRRHPALVVADDARKLDAVRARMEKAARELLSGRVAQVDRAAVRLEAMSPLRVLERGYALVYGPEGKLLRRSGDVTEGEAITARLSEGRVRARVTETE